MNELTVYSHPDQLLPTDARRVGRTLSRYQSVAALRTAAVDIATDMALAKAEALTTVTGQAMSTVIRVAQAQRQLEQLTPEASPRLAMLADEHALALGDMLADLRRELRRK